MGAAREHARTASRLSPRSILGRVGKRRGRVPARPGGARILAGTPPHRSQADADGCGGDPRWSQPSRWPRYGWRLPARSCTSPTTRTVTVRVRHAADPSEARSRFASARGARGEIRFDAPRPSRGRPYPPRRSRRSGAPKASRRGISKGYVATSRPRRGQSARPSRLGSGWAQAKAPANGLELLGGAVGLPRRDPSSLGSSSLRTRRRSAGASPRAVAGARRGAPTPRPRARLRGRSPGDVVVVADAGEVVELGRATLAEGEAAVVDLEVARHPAAGHDTAAIRSKRAPATSATDRPRLQMACTSVALVTTRLAIESPSSSRAVATETGPTPTRCRTAPRARCCPGAGPRDRPGGARGPSGPATRSSPGHR